MGTTWARQQPYQPGMVVAVTGSISQSGVIWQKQGTKISPRSIWESLKADGSPGQLRKEVAAQTSA